MPLAAGGGIRTAAEAQAVLDAGADSVSVNSAAVSRPGLLDELAAVLASQSLILAIDARRSDDGWDVRTAGGRVLARRDAIDWAREGVARGAGQILLTSMDRDGTLEGYDLDLIAAVRQAVSVPVIASGGAGSPEHLAEALEAGAEAVLCASILHYGAHRVAGIKGHLAARGIMVRPTSVPV